MGYMILEKGGDTGVACSLFLRKRDTLAGR